MTKQFTCLIDGCDATVEAETEDEVMAQVQDHAESAHPELELDDELIQRVRDNIRDV